MDFLLVMLAFYPHRLNAMAARKYFYYRPLNWFLPLMGAIPKYLFEADMIAVMAAMKVIKNGDQILLFPEGRDSVHGLYMGASTSLGKMIKKLQVPVISCTIEGSYNCMPFWRKAFRCGHIHLTFEDLFSVTDITNLTADEINSRINARLSGSDSELASMSTPASVPMSASISSPLPALDSAQKQLRLFRARKLVEGLENILYYCPQCHSEFTLKTQGNTISCTSCGSTATMDRAGLLSSENNTLPRTVADWYKAQVLYEKLFLVEDGDLIRADVLVSMPLDNSRGFEVCGEGELRLNSKGWFFDGLLSGESAQLFFPINTVPAVPFEPNGNIQICQRGNFYLFIPRDNPQASAKYATIGECVYWRFASPLQMMPGKDSGFLECRQERITSPN